ncbi:NAD(P)H-binding protein [Frankia sp. AiPs1]|uniref:NAD(P)H-binding protein n=1 Tax=Frankia sp. AiPa1 TaxID=573492 RepID=UPI00202AE71F|nr:NAD(P)H-binding protein [Frankia sp. AiPa1]MCL9761685.1 NAD(P)H-binding protein [Frankia sp. AiPa1]
MIVVTTPTGNIGSRLLEILLNGAEPDARAGMVPTAALGARPVAEPVRVIARRPEALPEAVRERVEVVPGSHGDPDVVAKAFAGADAVFWLAPPTPDAASLESAYLDFTRPACTAIREQGVRHVVTVSALGRGTPAAGRAGLVTATLAMDDLIADTGVAMRALVLPGFMENMLRQVAAIRDQGVFFSMASPDLRSPTCATRDIAAAAVGLLRERTWTGQGSVAVLGPQDLSCPEMAEIMSDVLGRPVRYQQVSAAAQYESLTGFGWSATMAAGMVDMMTAKNEGLDNAEPRTPRSSTPTSFRQWCEDTLRPAVLA